MIPISRYAGLRTESQSDGDRPNFFIGASPSMAFRIISPDYRAAGVMVSVNALRNRISDFLVGDWILDSGAFTEISRYGYYRYSIEEYVKQIERWSVCGNLLLAVSQDWMCEPFILDQTGLSVTDHQRLTIERYDQLVALNPPVPIMPVLQGYRISEYLSHIKQYGSRLRPGAWVGVGSVCRRNGNPALIADLLKTIKLIRPDLRLHGFGLKQLALESAEVRDCLYSCDSMAWSYPRKFRRCKSDCVQKPKRREIDDAHAYQEKVSKVLKGAKIKLPTRTSGAGNGQGRKPKWNRPTTAIRVPAEFADRLLALARSWDESNT